MTPLNQSEMDNFELPELVHRMDEIVLQSIIERYGQVHEGFPICRVSDIVNTQKVIAQSDGHRRKIAHIAFSYLVQLELHAVASGFSNKILFTPDYNDASSWTSPLFRLREDRPLGGIRRYGDTDTARIRFIKSAQKLGFSLDEVSTLLTLEDGTQCQVASNIAQQKLIEIRSKLANLRSMEKTLEKLVGECK
jgi:hypothetical protein